MVLPGYLGEVICCGACKIQGSLLDGWPFGNGHHIQMFGHLVKSRSLVVW